MFLNLLLPIVAPAKFVAIPQDLFATTVLGAITNASMIVPQSVGDPISVLVLGNAPARNDHLSLRYRDRLQRKGGRRMETTMEV